MGNHVNVFALQKFNLNYFSQKHIYVFCKIIDSTFIRKKGNDTEECKLSFRSKQFTAPYFFCRTISMLHLNEAHLLPIFDGHNYHCNNTRNLLFDLSSASHMTCNVLHSWNHDDSQRQIVNMGQIQMMYPLKIKHILKVGKTSILKSIRNQQIQNVYLNNIS